MVRWGILGTSYISEVMAQAIQSSNASELIAIASRSIDKAKTFAEKFSVPTYYSDYQAILDNQSIEAVYIGLPNHLHKEWIIRCAQAGKHILCEKPFVLTRAEAEEALAMVKSANVFCMEALMYRHHPLIAKLQQIVKEGTIGKIKLFNAVYTANIADIANTTAGGSIRNLGCYPVSLVRLLADSEPDVMTAAGRLCSSKQSDRQASVIMKFPNDVIATISTADDMKMSWQFDIYGTDGYLKMISNPWQPDRDNNKMIVQRNNEALSEIHITADKPLYTYQIDAMNNKIRHAESDTDVSGQDSVGNITVLDNWLRQVKLSM